MAEINHNEPNSETLTSAKREPIYQPFVVPDPFPGETHGTWLLRVADAQAAWMNRTMGRFFENATHG